ncbi:MAG: hypothetical protein GX446_04175 [Chthonomonadales bacterium]|nr:hypothetical protein [Chthonomonadales bacterium]
MGNPPGGPFYINEFRHVIVPIAASKGMGTGSVYYSCGRFDGDLKFEYEGRMLVTRPVDADGKALTPGTQWLGPRPGIPYVLSAGGSDIHYETPALTDTDPPDVRPNMTRRVQLGRVLGDRSLAARAAHPVAAVRGSLGGRFYVNEYGAMFTPVGRDDGTGLQYIYCGQIDTSAWFPEPPLG